MNGSVASHARSAWLSAIALALAGLACAVYFAALTWQGTISALPLPSAAWIFDRVHPGVLLCALGALLAVAGVVATMRQGARVRAERRRREDAARRVSQYRDRSALDAQGRKEPFIS
jgi:hypothetical protein